MIAFVVLATILATGDAPVHNIETETVCRILENNVCSQRHQRKQVLFTQLVFYRWRAGGYQCVGYLMLRPETNWQHIKRGDYHCIEFESRDGTFRVIRSKTYDKQDTKHDPEVIERQRGERECLFGLEPWGDVRG